MKKSKGFTFLDLLILIAILGIVSVIAVPNLLSAINRTAQKKSISDIRDLAGALNAFNNDKGGYPGPIPYTDATLIQEVSSNTFTPDYIQTIPKADGWRAPYTYLSGALSIARPAGNTPGQVSVNFGLYSRGSDGAEGCLGCTVGDFPPHFYGVGAGAIDPDSRPLTATSPATGCYQSDIIWVNTGFVQAPAGKQQTC